MRIFCDPVEKILEEAFKGDISLPLVDRMEDRHEDGAGLHGAHTLMVRSKRGLKKGGGHETNENRR